MAKEGIVDGGDVIASVKKDGGNYSAVGHATSCKISTSTSFRERRTKDTNGKERAPDETDTQISIESLTLYDGFSYFDLKAIQLAGEAVSLKYAPKVEEVDDKYEEGEFYIESLERSDSVAEDSTMSVTFTQKAKPEIKTFPAA